MKASVKKILTRTLLCAALLLCGVWGVLAYNARRAEPLQLWHTHVPREMSPAMLDSADWKSYIAHENALFEDIRNKVTLQLPKEAKMPMNRYYEGAQVYPPKLAHDWNRSYLLRPEGKPKGAVVLLHGLTDSPYSLRHIARLYVEKGFVAFGLRLPGHGTVPASLTDTAWGDWMAATRLTVREAAGVGNALHIVGFSNGGALAIKYTLDALEDTVLPRPDRVILLSPMIGITRLARFAELTAIPAIFPAFAHAAWLGILPEFNPFKYNSFPARAARQSYLLCNALQSQIVRLSKTEAFATLPPILTFQSVLDYTVSTPAVLYRLYAYWPENSSELVLYDVNRASLLGGLMRSGTEQSLQKLLPQGKQRYTLSIVKNRALGDQQTMMVTKKAGSVEETTVYLDHIYPNSIFSLSHGAIPFPMDDPLYGMSPAQAETSTFGITLGNLSFRGERGALIIPMEAILRTSSNPFFPLMLDRVEQDIDAPRPSAALPALVPAPHDLPDNLDTLFDDFLNEPDTPTASGASFF